MIQIPFVLATLLAPTLPTQQADASAPPRAQPSLSTLDAIRRSRVHYDERDDGTLWAAGADYKIGFSREGARYIPSFGSRQPENQPLSLSPRSLTVDGVPIACAAAVTPQRVDNRVSFARGGCSERYDLQPESLEQSFEFQTLPARGELVVRIPVPTTMTAAGDDAGLTFHSDFGRVTYSRAVAIDARGARAEATTDFVDGEIVIRVDAAFVIAAELPLVVDPIVTTFPGLSTAVDDMSPDCVWDPVGNMWFLVMQTLQSANDYDIWAFTFDVTGFVFGSAVVEISEGSWTNPRCAVLPSSHAILVVAEVTNVSPKIVVARRISHNAGAISANPTLINIGGSTVGDLTAPDVGGDPYPGTPAYFCVVFAHTLSGLEKEIGYRMVSPAGALVGAGPSYFAHTAGTSEAGPSISTSNDANTWTVAWQRSDAILPNTGGIWAARLDWTGFVVASPFLVVDSGLVERAPSVSSPLTGTNRMVIAYRQSSTTSGSGDIGLSALDGTTVLSNVNLTALEAAGTQALNQENPTVETEGYHFLVVYPEFESTAAHFDLYCSQVLLTGTQLSVFDGRSLVLNAPGSVRRSRVAGKLGTPGPTRFFAVYDVEDTSPTDRNVAYALIDTVYPGTVSLFCPGDGTGTPCPCANSGLLGRGCAHSASATGSLLLEIGGFASVSSDMAQIEVSNVPPSAPCLFFQGTAKGVGSGLGDGLLCVSGTITRLAVVFASGTSALCPMGLAAMGAVPATGGLRTYQAWYRDSSSSFCSASTFNLSNGVAIYWAP